MAPARILIVDDDEGIRTSVRMCLEATGYAVHHAVDGADALERIHQIVPHLVLLDLAMPAIDGMTLLAEIRSLVDRPPRVIIMTAHGTTKTAIQAGRLGADDFLVKPFTPERLRRSVAAALESARLVAHASELSSRRTPQ